MTRAECLRRMKAPGDKRGDACYGVMQIVITNRCDLGACANCTQLIPHQDRRIDMSLDNARRAIDSVADYPGVVGIFGGNPALHPQFRAISEHLAAAIPDRARRGLWANNLAGHGDVVRRVYGYFNLNVHGNNNWAAEMHDALPGVKVWGEPTATSDGSSVHGPVAVALSDVLPRAAERWAAIAQCDVNQRWSPAVAQLVDGELCGFFCEVAAAWASLVGCAEAVRVPVEAGWWRAPMAAWAGQVDAYCHTCGVPLRLAGRPDHDQVDDVSDYWRARLAPARCVDARLEDRARELTDYMGLREGQE